MRGNWTRDQRYCTVCALAVLVGFLVFALYLSPASPSQTPANSGDCPSCSGAQQQQEPPSFRERFLSDPVAVFTLFLAAATLWLAYATNKQVNLGRAEFVSTHRPRLRARGFDIATPDSDIDPDEAIKVIFSVHNIGDTRALISGISALIHVAPRPGPLPPNLLPVYQKRIDPPIPLDAGAPEILLIPSDVFPSEVERTAIYAGDRPLYCIGTVYYRDEVGTERETAFCRRFHFRPYRCETIQNPDYEYEY